MTDILPMLPPLIVLMIANILLGLYAKIGIEEIEFDWKKLVSGIIKAVIIGIAALSLAYATSVIDLSGVGVEPATLITAAIVLYAQKAFTNLAKCLNVNTTTTTSK